MTRSFEHKKLCFAGLSERVYSHCIQIRTWEKVIEVQMKYQITLPFVETLATRGRATGSCGATSVEGSCLPALLFLLCFVAIICPSHWLRNALSISTSPLNFYGHLCSLLFGKDKKVLLKPVARLYKKAVHFEIQN